MSPTMRKKLERNIEYHQAMADYHADQVKKKAAAETHAPAGNARRPTASASPPKEDPDEHMAKTHAEVVKQLQELLDKEPMIPAIVTAAQTQPVRRDPGGDLKPSAGVWH